MKELTALEVNIVCGGNDRQQAQACANDVMTGGGMGATLGAIIGGAIFSVIPGVGTAAGATLGGLAGAMLGGGAVAESSPNCEAPKGSTKDD